LQSTRDFIDLSLQGRSCFHLRPDPTRKAPSYDKATHMSTFLPAITRSSSLSIGRNRAANLLLECHTFGRSWLARPLPAGRISSHTPQRWLSSTGAIQGRKDEAITTTAQHTVERAQQQLQRHHLRPPVTQKEHAHSFPSLHPSPQQNTLLHAATPHMEERVR